MSSNAEKERQDGGSPPKRGRTDAVPQLLEPSPSVPLADQAAELSEGGPPPSVLPKTLKQCYCLACGETSTHQFKSAPVGFKVAILLLLGEKKKNFNGQADVCRACERTCGPIIGECEALVVSLPTSTSTGPLKLSASLQIGLRLRKQLSVLRDDFALRGDITLYEKLLALNAEAPSRYAGDHLVLLPVPPGYIVHISNRYYSGQKHVTCM